MAQFDLLDDGEDRAQDLTAYDRLALALLESVVGREGIIEIAGRQRYCLVVQAPAADWVTPLYRGIKQLGHWRYAIERSAAGRSRSYDDPDERVVISLSEGDRIFGVSQDPKAHLPQAMLTSADRLVSLPQPSAEVVGRVITEVTGKSPGHLPGDLCVGLSFDEIVGCIRVGSSASECADRLKRAAKARNRVQAFGPDVPEIKDLHGYGAAQQWALDLIQDLGAYRRGEIGWDAVSSPLVILQSPPGRGKTAMVRSLAKSSDLPLIATSVGQWFANSPGYLDSIVKQIDQVFAAARAVAPAILFLDEIDAIPNRLTMSRRGADWWTPIITHLLTLLDGTNPASTEKLVIVGATNHVDRLDEALIRPGRLSRVIEIAPPDERALAGIFRQHLGGDLEGADLTHAGRLAFGCLATGAQVVEWVKAARRIARAEKRAMTLADLLLAIAPGDQRSERDRRRAAVHEAGHALAAHLTGNTPVGISTIEDGRRDGFTIFENGRLETRGDIEDLVTQFLAGRAAEELVLGEVSAGAGMVAGSDLARATKFAGALHLSAGLGEHIRFQADVDKVLDALATDCTAAQRVEDDLRRLYLRAMELLCEHRPILQAVTEELMLHRYVARERFLELVGKASPGVRNG